MAKQDTKNKMALIEELHKDRDYVTHCSISSTNGGRPSFCITTRDGKVFYKIYEDQWRRLELPTEML